MTLDVAVVCEINVDIVATGLTGQPKFGAEQLIDDVTLTAGSSGVLTATNLASLGLQVGVCGLTGDDLFGRYMLAHFDRYGIDRSGVIVDAHERTGAAILLSSSHDRAILTFSGCMVRFGLDRVRFDLVARARHLHVSSHFLQTSLRPHVPMLLARARRLGLTTSADTGHDPAEIWDVDGLFEELDVFLPNEVEACAISGQPDAVAALEWFAGRVPTVVVKRGAAGAIAARAGQRVAVPGFPVHVVDTTGAGDAFDAGFLDGMLAGDDLDACVRRGNACGALTAAHIGGTGAISPERVDGLLSR